MKYFIILITAISFSHANTWENVAGLKANPIILEIPDSNNIFTMNSQGEISYLYKSSDGGYTWELLHTFNERLWIQSMSAPTSDDLYFGFNKGVLMKSNDGGQTFQKIEFDNQYYFSRIENFSMFDNLKGVITSFNKIVLTKNSWDSFEIIYFPVDTLFYTVYNPTFLNDSIIYCISGNSYKEPQEILLIKFNINSYKYELYQIDKINNIEHFAAYLYIEDFCIVNENLMFVCGQSHGITGGPGRDAIYKTTDGGKNWRRVLDLSTSDYEKDILGRPYTLQSIAFKDSLTGIATGQFRKILYTYDGGESWIYETDLNETYKETTPPTTIIRYAGTTPIMATYTGQIYKMTEDTYAPKPEDIYTVSGKVWESDTGQANIPVVLGYRVTMTDSNGYYKFINVALGSYTLKVLNKYYDGVNKDYYYKPYTYAPENYNLVLSGDTTGLDFNATDTRTYHSLGGTIKDEQGNPLVGIEVQANISTTFTDATNQKTYTDSSGYFDFPKLEQWYYTFKPVSDKWQFEPEEIGVRLKFSADDADFNASLIPEDTNKYYSVSGRIIRNGEVLPNYEFELGGQTEYSNLEGVYKFDKVKAGEITVTPTFYLYNDNIYLPEYYTINLISDTTGLDFEITNSTGVFDNPPNRVYISDGILFVSDNLLGINSRLYISDLTGRILHQSQVRPQIDMRHFPPGLYFIAIITERGSKRIWKVVR